MSTATREQRIVTKRTTQVLHVRNDGIDIEVSPFFRWKGAFERGLAAVMLVAALPLMGVLMLVIRSTSRGPAVFRQVRVGRGGRLFTMYKFRTMVQSAEAQTGPVWAVTNDPRLTPIGHLIRKTHLDELPQLWNVVRGEMSLVGPRPERPEFTHSLEKAIPGYANRLAVLPGITGLAQINLPADSDLDSVRRKLVLDLEYVRTGSFFIDVRVLLCTCFRAIGFSGFHASRLLGVRRNVVFPESPAAAAMDVAADADASNAERSRHNGHAHATALAIAARRPR
jgi:lipopolysaccharide/colanic/teichoic acid biosynthesis glycosyltransferase